MPPPSNPPKPTKAQMDAAKAARALARPLKANPATGRAKPKASDGGIKNPAATRTPAQARRAADGAWRLSMLDATSTASEFIILEPASTT